VQLSPSCCLALVKPYLTETTNNLLQLRLKLVQRPVRVFPPAPKFRVVPLEVGHLALKLLLLLLVLDDAVPPRTRQQGPSSTALASVGSTTELWRLSLARARSPSCLLMLSVSLPELRLVEQGSCSRIVGLERL